MKKVIGFLLFPLCAVLLLSLIVTPQTKIQHRDSSAFQLALQQAVDRLEGGSKLLLAGTVTPVAASPAQATFDGRYTCDTYEPVMPTCDPAAGCFAHTADPQGHTCVNGEYTCEMFTCDTYDHQMATCDPNDPTCPTFPHTTEPRPFNHTCEGHTCDGSFTCDFTVDPRALTCDAADPQCLDFTFDAFMTTCDPMRPECRENNPGHCTAQNYPTCVAGVVTCDVADPLCVTINPARPECATPVRETTWGQIKAKYSEQQ